MLIFGKIFLVNRRGTLTLIGFILLFIGVISFVVNLVGLNFRPLIWLNAFGKGPGVIFRLVIIFLGAILMYIDSTRQLDEY